ncbi:Crp/Fnr family transcriptional regulator [Dongia sp.]|uniref:Crp/Fnr family transcriptional regulator n=1 Tax=Dongia sp. TaxID=1977262 RepID=UPI0035B25ACC
MEGLRTGHRHFPAKRTIYREGEIAPEMLIIFDGWAFRFKLLAGGRRQILSFLLPGDPISLPLLSNDRLSFSVQSLTSVTACSFERGSFADFVAEHPAVARQAHASCYAAASAADERLTDLGRRSAYERVGRLILELVTRMEAKGLPTGNPMLFPLGQTHIADALGLTSIHAGRVLRRFRREGILSLHRGRLEIMDCAALRRL